MAVVGEAYILVRAITTEIKKDIANGFDGVKGQSTKEGNAAGQAFGQSFGNQMRDQATMAAKSFFQLMRRGYSVQAGIGAALSSVVALVGALGALAGALAGAATSGIALVGVMVQMKVAGMVGKMAFKGVMEAVQKTGSEGVKSLRELREEMQQLAFDAEEAALSEESAALRLESARETLARVQDLPPNNRARREAELAYQQAELAYRRARDKNNDLQEELANPKKAAAAGGPDPMAQLTKSQVAFAQYLRAVKPRMKELTEAAASSFLPELTKQMKVLFESGYFDMLVRGFEDVSKGLGKAVSEFAGTMFDPSNRANLSAFFESTGRTLGTMGRVVGNFFGYFMTLMKAADPLIGRLVHFLDRKVFSLGDASKKNFGQLNAFFKNAGDAAADFGRLLSNIFQPFKRLVMSQVGPGSAGREFLDWMKQSSESLREFKMGADGLTLNEKLMPMVENTKAIFTAFSGLGKALFDLGRDPGVKEFWTILGQGTSSVQSILQNIVSATGPAFARVIVAILQILQEFSDGAQLEAYFDTLAEIFTVFAQIAATLGDVMRLFGPMTGVIGALVTGFLLLKSAGTIVVGAFGILRGSIVSLTALSYKQIIAQRIQIAVQKQKNIADTLSLALSKKTLTAKNLETIAEYRNVVASNADLAASKKKQILSALDAVASGKKLTAKQAETIAEIQNTTAKNANIAAQKTQIIQSLAAAKAGDTVTASIARQGLAAGAAKTPVTLFGIALNAALWPIIAIAGAVALAIGGIALAIGHKNNQMKQASSDTQKELKKITDVGVSENERLAYSQKVWTASLSSTGDTANSSIKDITKLTKATEVLSQVQPSMVSSFGFIGDDALKSVAEKTGQYDEATTEALDSQTELREGLKNLGSAFGAIAKVDMKMAQRGFVTLANAQYNVNRTQEQNLENLRTQIKEMPAFQEQLQATADKYSLTNDAMTEQEKIAVLTDIALRRGAYGAILAAEAQQVLANKLKDAAASFIDVNAPLEKFTTKGIVDLKGYQGELDKQLTAQVNWFDNLQKVQAKGIKGSTYKALIDMGKEGANLVATLAKSTRGEVKTWEKTFNAVIPDTTAGLANALTDPTVLFDILGKKVGAAAGGYNAQIVTKLKADLKAGKTTIGKIMQEQGITVADIMQGLADTKPIKQKIEWDGDSITKLREKLAEEMGKTTLTITTGTVRKDGGLIKFADGGIAKFANGGLMKFANGGNVLKRFAPGGQVFGQGGPRSDKIPAMLSNGEYVVNAAATARTLPLLNAINYGVTQKNADAGTMVGGGGGSLMSSVNITVNPAPGMDEAELAAMVGRELSAQMRRGASS
jgi:hypothetical protein